jgi:hypothetical protein
MSPCHQGFNAAPALVETALKEKADKENTPRISPHTCNSAEGEDCPAPFFFFSLTSDNTRGAFYLPSPIS